MSAWEIVDRRGFENLRLGDPRELVRQRFGSFEVFRRGASPYETDHFVEKGILVTYGLNEQVNLIELAPPADPTLSGVHFFERPTSEVLDELRTVGVDATVLETEVDGLIDSWGISFWAPDNNIEAISFELD